MSTTTEITTLDPELIESVQAEVQAVDPGPLPQCEDDAILYRVLRFRARLTSERERIAEAMALMLNEFDRRIAGLDYHYAPLLEDIVRRKIAGGKLKSVKTPFGIAGFRTIAAKLEITDEAKLPAECWREIPATKAVDRAKIGETFKATGEVPPGCDVVRAEEKFYLK